MPNRSTHPIFALFLHLRPKSWPTVAAHMAAGAFMARGAGAVGSGALAPLLWGCFAWTVLLNGGTLALNSAVDRDDGSVGYLKNPPLPPRGMGVYGFGLMLLGLPIAWWIGVPYFIVYAVSIPLSWVYSVPPLRLKARGGWDVIVNMVGYGALTPLAGWLCVASPPRGFDVLIFFGFGFLFGAVYPMTQYYQMDEDRAKGARTLAIRLGVGGSMVFSLLTILLANGCWVAAGLQLGAPFSLAAWVAWGMQFALWIGLALVWWARFDRFPHERGFYLSMACWAVTNVTLVLAFGWWR